MIVVLTGMISNEAARGKPAVFRHVLPREPRARTLFAMEWKASHILVASHDLARKIRQELQQGARFEDLARRYSTCPSKSSGGDLGWFGPGKMVKEFETACRKLGVGSLSDPIRTQFGYHVIKVTGKR